MSTTVLLSLDEFIARPERDDFHKEELIEGELIVSPGAKLSHAYIVDQIREGLRPLRNHGFVVTNDFSCILSPRSMPVPDLAAVRHERYLAAARADAWLEGSPELVIEVASPSNRKLHVKADVYLEHGAEQVWLVYPKRRSVTVCTSEGTTEARSNESLDFHGVRIQVVNIFLP